MWLPLLLFMATNVAGFRLTVLHINDFHVRFEQTNSVSAECKDAEAEAGKCFGGVARLYETVQHFKKTEPNVIFLNGGDMYQGTIWYSVFKWRVVAPFMNKLNFSASVSLA